MPLDDPPDQMPDELRILFEPDESVVAAFSGSNRYAEMYKSVSMWLTNKRLIVSGDTAYEDDFKPPEYDGDEDLSPHEKAVMAYRPVRQIFNISSITNIAIGEYTLNERYRYQKVPYVIIVTYGSSTTKFILPEYPHHVVDFFFEEVMDRVYTRYGKVNPVSEMSRNKLSKGLRPPTMFYIPEDSKGLFPKDEWVRYAIVSVSKSVPNTLCVWAMESGFVIRGTNEYGRLETVFIPEDGSLIEAKTKTISVTKGVLKKRTETRRESILTVVSKDVQRSFLIPYDVRPLVFEKFGKSEPFDIQKLVRQVEAYASGENPERRLSSKDKVSFDEEAYERAMQKFLNPGKQN